MKIIKKGFLLLFKFFSKPELYIIQLDDKKILLSQAYKKGSKLHLKKIQSKILSHNEITPSSLGNLTAINQTLSFHINKGCSIKPKIIASLPSIKQLNSERKKLIILQAILSISKNGFIIDRLVTTPLILQENNPAKHTPLDSCPSLQVVKTHSNILSLFLPPSYQTATLWIGLAAISLSFSLLFVTFSYEHAASAISRLDKSSLKFEGLHKRQQKIAKKAQAIKMNETKLKNTINKLIKEKDASSMYLQLIMSIAEKMPHKSRLETLSITPDTKNKKTKQLLLTLRGITQNTEEISDLIQRLLKLYPDAHFSLENIEKTKKQSKYKDQKQTNYSFFIKSTMKI